MCPPGQPGEKGDRGESGVGQKGPRGPAGQRIVPKDSVIRFCLDLKWCLFGIQVHQGKAGLALQVLLDPLGPAALLDVQGTPVSAVPPDQPGTATPPSVSAFLTTGRDTEVRTRETKDRRSHFPCPPESHDLRQRAHIHRMNNHLASDPSVSEQAQPKSPNSSVSISLTS